MFLVYRKSKPEGSCNFRSGSNPELGAIPCPRLIYALHRFDPPAPRRRPWPAAPAIDPVFELIEIHRNAHAAHMTALHLQARLEKTRRPSDVGWVSTKPCHDEGRSNSSRSSRRRRPRYRACSQNWIISRSWLANSSRNGWCVNARNAPLLSKASQRPSRISGCSYEERPLTRWNSRLKTIGEANNEGAGSGPRWVTSS